MDCLTTQRTLDLLRPGHSAQELAEAEEAIPAPIAAEARSHLTGCELCQGVVARHLRFDARVGEAFRNVPVPMGLRERLIAAVQTAELAQSASQIGSLATAEPVGAETATNSNPQPLPTRENPRVPGQRRRFWFKQLAACALLLITGFAGWSWFTPKRVPIEQLVQATTAANLDPAALVAYSRSAALPQDLWVPTTVDRDPARELVVNGVPAAIRFFKVLNRKRVAIPVRLVAVPRSSVQFAVNSPGAGRIAYVGSWAVWTWSEGNTQFVVALEGGEGELMRLIRHQNVI